MRKPMLRALKHVAKVKLVKAWPWNITDGTINQLRREGYLETTYGGGINMAGGVGWGNQYWDELTDKGRRAINKPN